MKTCNKRFLLNTIYYLLPIVFLLTGCATVKEAGRGFLGISTKVLEDGRDDARKKSFAIDMDSCYLKVKSALKEYGAYVYAEKDSPRMIAVYLSSEDTTPVGLFFTKESGAKTLVEISSPSTYAKETIANAVFEEHKASALKNKERVINVKNKTVGK